MTPDHRPASPTQADVARAAGVSTAVVSYVVNNGPRPVSPEARERVEAAIQALGYSPNASARALRSGASRLLGVCVPGARNPYHAELVEHVATAADQAGYGTLLMTTDASPRREDELITALIDRGVDGLIISPTKAPQAYDHLTRHLPTALLCAAAPSASHHTIGADLEDGARQAVTHLIGHGHTSSALLMAPLDSWDLNGRVRGWKAALAEHDLPQVLIETTEWSRVAGRRAMLQLLDTPTPPTAVLAGSDLLALGALRALWERGMTAPRDMALVSTDGTESVLMSTPRLTTLTQPFEAMAAAAVDAVTEPQRKATLTLFPMRLETGESCGCA